MTSKTPSPVQEALEKIFKEFRSKGFRITKARRKILEIMYSKHCPLSAQEVHGKVRRAKVPADLSTVYRELQFLSEEKILTSVFFQDGIQRFEISDQNHHHHHLVCNACESVEAIEMHQDLDQLESNIRKQKNFRVLSHSLEFYGLCGNCHR